MAPVHLRQSSAGAREESADSGAGGSDGGSAPRSCAEDEPDNNYDGWNPISRCALRGDISFVSLHLASAARAPCQLRSTFAAFSDLHHSHFAAHCRSIVFSCSKIGERMGRWLACSRASLRYAEVSLGIVHMAQ